MICFHKWVENDRGIMISSELRSNIGEYVMYKCIKCGAERIVRV